MSVVADRQKKVIAEFHNFSNWEDRYRRIIEIGKALPPIDEKFKTEDFKVKGCQSQVWMNASLGQNGNMVIVGESDAMIVSGLVALLIQVYSEADPEEVLNTPPDFLKDLGFTQHLSASRTNGLFSMVKQIMYYAQAFRAMKMLSKNPGR
jgi:cysteine desulfuration protein SufE